MEKGLLFFTLALTAIWIILDDFYGGKHLSKMAQKMTPDISTPIDVVKDGWESTKDTVEEAGKTAKKAVEKASGYDTYKKYQKMKPEQKKKAKKAAKDSFIDGFWNGLKRGFGIG